ncbi:YggT family protein [soil metagenome]
MSGLVAYIAQALLITAWVLLLGRVLMSWVDPTFSKPLGQFLFSITEPVLAPIRRVLPQAGMFDFSPLILLLVLSMLIRLVAI